ncbi:MAG: hypothetical protein IPK13_25230 [Deltaproteobacteria bacterium]|nr:hypothetical protein [Deltaproteobacteria bacterium]
MTPKAASSNLSSPVALLTFTLLASLCSPGVPGTSAGSPGVLRVEFQPAGEPQIAVWLEDESGHFIDTLMITRSVGTFGLGNRPGRPDFPSGFRWPYGRREMTLPVWAHRRGVRYDRRVMQNCREDALGWHETYSSVEPFYCRPTTPAENSVDAITCPTSNFNSDKGRPLRSVPSNDPHCKHLLETQSLTTFYPPRNDLLVHDPSKDWGDVSSLGEVNDLDAISQATPPAHEHHRLSYSLPGSIAPGTYVVFVEVNEEYDSNAFYPPQAFNDPALRDYGEPSIGQPSVVFRAPIVIGDVSTATRAAAYFGFGSEDGQDGEIRRPDGSINEYDGSGADRLESMATDGAPARVAVFFHPAAPCRPPPPVTDLHVLQERHDGVRLTFMASSLPPDDPPVDGDIDGDIDGDNSGSSTQEENETEDDLTYEMRYVEGVDAMQSDDAFERGIPGPRMMTTRPGDPVEVQLGPLRPETQYTIAVRTQNRCLDRSAIVTLAVRTSPRVFETVDACFIATAAYGTRDAKDVVVLRRFRDEVLMTSAEGRAAVRVYYRLSPSLAGPVRAHAPLRAIVRGVIHPLAAVLEATTF